MTERHGFSLIEVILSTALLLGSVVVLNELAGIGRRQAQRSASFAEAQSRCHQVVTELVTGTRPVEFVQREPLLPAVESLTDRETRDSDVFGDITAPDELSSTLESPDWLYSVTFEPVSNLPGLTLLTVTVEQAEGIDRNPARCTLRRWVRGAERLEAESGVTQRSPFDGGFGREDSL